MLGMVFGQRWRLEWAKLTSFECGFDPLRRSRDPFSLRFFLLALLFLIFDVELILLFPFIYRTVVLSCKMTFLGKLYAFLFLVLLLLGLIHELNEGTLE